MPRWRRPDSEPSPSQWHRNTSFFNAPRRRGIKTSMRHISSPRRQPYGQQKTAAGFGLPETILTIHKCRCTDLETATSLQESVQKMLRKFGHCYRSFSVFLPGIGVRVRRASTWPARPPICLFSGRFCPRPRTPNT